MEIGVQGMMQDVRRASAAARVRLDNTSSFHSPRPHARLRLGAAAPHDPRLSTRRRHRPPQGGPPLPAGPGPADEPSARAGLRARRGRRRHGRAQRRAQGLRPGADDGAPAVRALHARTRRGRASLLRQLLEDAHTVIKLTALSSEQEPHSTLAAFLMNPEGDCAWIHAGDSRIYHFQRGQLVKRTQGPLLRAGAGRPRRDQRRRGQRPPAEQHPAGLPGHEVDAAAGRHPLHPAAAARRCADGLQRRPVALLQARGDGRGAGRAVAARRRGIAGRRRRAGARAAPATTSRWSSLKLEALPEPQELEAPDAA